MDQADTQATDPPTDDFRTSGDTPIAPPPRRSLWRIIGGVVLVLVLLVLLAIGALVGWASTQGSLSTALNLAGKYIPLHTENIHGKILGGGSVGRLHWEDNGLRVVVDDAQLDWRPMALLNGQLDVRTLHAKRVVIDDQSPPSKNPSEGPPRALALPLNLPISVESLKADEVVWKGPPEIIAHDVDAQLRHKNHRYTVDLRNLRYQDEHGVARIQAHATLDIDTPMTLHVAAAGAGMVHTVESEKPAAVALQATLDGPLKHMNAWAHGQATPNADIDLPASDFALPELPATHDSENSGSPTLTKQKWTPPGGDTKFLAQIAATARITPWDKQSLPEAHAVLDRLDVGAFLGAAPHTQLSGQIDAQPVDSSTASDTGWALQTQLTNGNAGPWDQHFLPINEAQADLVWQNGTATINHLKAKTGGGTVETSGRWASATAKTDPANRDQQNTHWELEATIDNVNPAQLQSTLAAFPMNGQATVRGTGSEGDDIDFDVALAARDSTAPTPTGKTDPNALASQLKALALREVKANGSWKNQHLALDRLLVRTDDARVAGNAKINLTQTDRPEGVADITLEAPGLTGAVNGNLQAKHGDGKLALQLADAGRALTWAKKLPGIGPALADMQAQGSATLDGRWQGGWQNPQIHARLDSPQLKITPNQGAEPIHAERSTITVDGTLAQMQIKANGHAGMADAHYDLDLGAHGGRTGSFTTLANTDWHFTIDRLQAGMQQPTLGKAPWQLGSNQAIKVDWKHANGGSLVVGPGQLLLRKLDDTNTVKIALEPMKWHAGQLTSSGHLDDFPMAWAEQLSGGKLSEAGLTGDVMLGGHWDVALGDTIKINAKLERTRGDLTVAALDQSTGQTTRVAAGVRKAELVVHNEGNIVRAELDWDSERAGTIHGAVQTRLEQTQDRHGNRHWSWRKQAPISGAIQADLPDISAWSVLAPPGWRLHGKINLDTKVSGTGGAPELTGNLSADGLALRSVVQGLQFENGKLRARLQGTRVVLDEFTLYGPGDDGGQIVATGEAGIIDGQMQARMRARIERLKASIRDDRRVTVSGNLEASFADRLLDASGKLKINKAVITLPDESRPALGDDVIVRGPGGIVTHGADAAAQLAAAESASKSEDDEPNAIQAPLNAKVDIQLDLGEDFQLEGMGIDTRLAGTLTLRANGPIDDAPKLTGTITTEGGTFHAYGQNLDIKRGNVRFSGQMDNPSIDVLALRPIYTSNQKAGVQVAGTALLPRVRLYSDPTLSNQETLAWLMLGHAAPNSGAEAAMLQSAALAALGGRDSRGLAANFGLDELSINPDTQGDTGTSVTLGKRLSKRLYAAYQQSLADAGSTLLLFYELSRRWNVRAQAGQAESAIDLIFRLTYN